MVECLEDRDFRILKETACSHQNHTFVWTTNGSSDEAPPTLPCDCGLWSWNEWNERIGEWADDK